MLNNVSKKKKTTPKNQRSVTSQSPINHWRPWTHAGSTAINSCLPEHHSTLLLLRSVCLQPRPELTWTLWLLEKQLMVIALTCDSYHEVKRSHLIWGEVHITYSDLEFGSCVLPWCHFLCSLFNFEVPGLSSCVPPLVITWCVSPVLTEPPVFSPVYLTSVFAPCVSCLHFVHVLSSEFLSFWCWVQSCTHPDNMWSLNYS